MKKIGVVVGSFREGSFSKSLATNIMELFPKDYELKEIQISDLPIYTEDYDNGKLQTPEAYNRFRSEAKEFAGYVFVTPEHNRTFSAVLKNALDVGSRPYGSSVWGGKPALVVSQSPGNLSGFGANHHLRQVLAFLDVYPMQQPEVYLAHSFELLDENNNFKNADTKKFVEGVIASFTEHIKRFK